MDAKKHIALEKATIKKQIKKEKNALKKKMMNTIEEGIDMYYNEDESEWTNMERMIVNFHKEKTDRIVYGGNAFWQKIEPRHLKIYTFRNCAGYTLI